MGTNQSRNCERIDMSEDDLLARLATAANKGCERDLRNLLKAGAFVDGFTMYGKSALHHAARNGQYSCVRILLEHNARVNIASYDRRTPLMEAAERGYTDCLIMLLNYGADPNNVSTDQMTALHYAARNGHKDCLEKLLQSGSNVDAIASGGWRPLHFAARHGHSMCVKLLLEYKARVDPPTAAARSLNPPLHHAAMYGHSCCLELLLNAGSNVNTTDKKGWTALHWAAYHGKLQSIETLIRYGANVNATTFYDKQYSYKDTPLHFAISYHHEDCALRLIQANANLNCRSEPHGKTPIDLAKQYQLRIHRHMEIVSRTPPSLKTHCYSLIRQCLKPDVVTRVKKLDIPLDLQKEMLFPKFPKLQE